MISVEDALQIILSQVSLMGTERVDIGEGCGRVLAEPVSAGFNVPPFDNSAMDGYAVLHEDIHKASQEHPAKLNITADLPAGTGTRPPVESGNAVRIMTGAPVPPGADTVVMQEDTRCSKNQVEIFSAPGRGANIRRAGEDITRGDVLIRAGEKLRPAHSGILASAKRSRITVYQRPRVAILSTGDELVDIDEELSFGKIVTSNTYSLSALVSANGGMPTVLCTARDTKDDLRKRLSEGLNADIILSSGGVSVGDYDFVKDVLQDLGLNMQFWKVSMRPGQPLAFGTISGKPTFGLPGNPVSVMVSFEQFVAPAMRKMCGLRTLFKPIVTALAEDDVTVGTGKKYFIRCRLSLRDGRYFAKTTGEQGSGILMSMAEANGLMIIPEDQVAVRAGDTVKVQILDDEFGYTKEPG